MKKLKLDIDEIKVETFNTSPSISKRQGTANGYLSYPNTVAVRCTDETCDGHTSPCQSTCVAYTCANTCQDTCEATCVATCNTCGDTCGGWTCVGVTCDKSCAITCYPTNCETVAPTCP